jgi:hypothetical protein
MKIEQLAVEWLLEQMDVDTSWVKEEVEQAKAMEKEQRGYSEEQVLEVFEHFKMHLPFHYEFLVKEHLQQLKQQEQ